jgi:hypothetical protein
VDTPARIMKLVGRRVDLDLSRTVPLSAERVV